MKRLVFACAGMSAEVALIYQQQWLAAGLTGAGVVLVLAMVPVVAEGRRQWADAVAELRRTRELELPPVADEPESRPPWETAPMPVVPVVADREELRVARHGKRRGIREALMGALTTAARVGLKD